MDKNITDETYEIELREDERKCPYCGCVNNVINNRCLECHKALSDKEILKEISENDEELAPISKRLKTTNRIALASRIALLFAITGCSVAVAQKASETMSMTFLAIAAGLIAIYGISLICASRIQKNLIQRAEEKVLRFKHEHGFNAEELYP